ncbi:MAG TPA: nitrile hydratase subunit beta [Roseiarcus sp.]|jgi:nitrile hydratase
MNGAQDLGGMMGFGAIAPETDEPVFHHEWEKRALAATLSASACGLWNIDVGRHARETLPPPAYLTKSYYDIWTSGLEKLVLRTGMISEAEMHAGKILTPARTVPRKLAAADVAGALAKGTRYDRPASTAALFVVGETIRTRVMNPTTHTRLPRYARGKRGVVEAVRGCFVFPDANAHGGGEDPRWLYTVHFSAAELWGASADPSLEVSIDAWEPYLERA